jgi:hypothetical protein
MHNLDGIKNIRMKWVRKPKPARKLNILRFFDFRQIATVAITFIITFVFSIATSQTLANNNAANAQGKVLGAYTQNNANGSVIDSTAATNTTATSSAAADTLSVTNVPQENASLNTIVLNTPQLVFLPNENTYAPDPLINRKAFLEQYLTAKHSVLADHVDAISDQSQWKLIIAIAQAESSSCKKYPEHTANCWGIGGAKNLMSFDNLDAAIAHVNALLEKKYISQGLDQPAALMKKWVGYKSDNWEAAVQQELDNLKNIQ